MKINSSTERHVFERNEERRKKKNDVLSLLAHFILKVQRAFIHHVWQVTTFFFVLFSRSPLFLSLCLPCSRKFETIKENVPALAQSTTFRRSFWFRIQLTKSIKLAKLNMTENEANEKKCKRNFKNSFIFSIRFYVTFLDFEFSLLHVTFHCIHFRLYLLLRKYSDKSILI